MKDESKKESKLSRRQLLPLLGGSLLIPFAGIGNTNEPKKPVSTADDDEYDTLLKPDGTAVRVKKTAVKNSKIVEQQVSNKSLLNWLDKKL